MSYTALYRKYRPAVFAEVCGQDAIVTTLRNQIRSGRVGHAYLFSGTRGTGKTTLAKIFARAVNCEAPEDGEPCGKCESCRAMMEGKSLNIIEIDAASNNGVENIRTIRDEVAYPPTQGKKKVYIIDEVHMLSGGAFNALLKTLEEPPSYVIFILATTEAHKIPVTILSRCQRYDFRRISTDEIAGRVAALLEMEGVETEPEAVRYIARKADGGMRDALSLTDQCISFYLGQKLTADRVMNVLGAIDTEAISSFLRKIAANDAGGALKDLSGMCEAGKDLSVLISDVTEYLRDVMLLKASEDAGEMLDVSPEQMQLLYEDAAAWRDDMIMRYIRTFSELAGQIRYAYNKRVLTEIAVIRLCRPQMRSDELSMAERVRALERLAEQGRLAGPPPESGRAGAGPEAGAPGTGAADALAGHSTEVAAGGGAGEEKDPSGEFPAYAERAVPADLQQIKGMWRGITEGLSSQRKKEVCTRAELMFDPADPEERLVVAFGNFLGEPYLGDGALAGELEALISEKLGKEVRVRFILLKDISAQKGALQTITREEERDLQSHIGIPIETDDSIGTDTEN